MVNIIRLCRAHPWRHLVITNKKHLQRSPMQFPFIIPPLHHSFENESKWTTTTSTRDYYSWTANWGLGCGGGCRKSNRYSAAHRSVATRTHSEWWLIRDEGIRWNPKALLIREVRLALKKPTTYQTPYQLSSFLSMPTRDTHSTNISVKDSVCVLRFSAGLTLTCLLKTSDLSIRVIFLEPLFQILKTFCVDV